MTNRMKNKSTAHVSEYAGLDLDLSLDFFFFCSPVLFTSGHTTSRGM